VKPSVALQSTSAPVFKKGVDFGDEGSEADRGLGLKRGGREGRSLKIRESQQKDNRGTASKGKNNSAGVGFLSAVVDWGIKDSIPS